MCLQEVVSVTHSKLLSALGTTYKYSYPENLAHRYGCIILSKYPIEKSTSLKFRSNMGRQLDIVNIRLPTSHSIVIANTHFESEFGENNTLKTLQYRYTSAILHKIHMDHIHDKKFLGTILCSDTNLTKHDEIKYMESFGTFLDAWDIDGRIETKKYTYDTKENILLSESENQIQSRLDRILYIPANGLLQSSFNMIKGNLIEISDHFGIIANMSYNINEKN
jgi:endonuclease/exonuclease/phosphatase family metal-dependent hydrolase